ncbi:MAG: phenylalanine--tRNA ligase subunit alpha [Candidatus Omnitrophica bacterium]|nr:phenylalanine--tRNA ligase subunit alpha [Candidatus Omnitrophota bacterium]
MSDADPLARLAALEAELTAQLSDAESLDELESLRIAILGRKGQLAEFTKSLGALPDTARPVVGQRLNAVKAKLTALLDEKRSLLSRQGAQAAVGRADITLPGTAPALGRHHPITRLLGEVCQAFESLGFEIVEGPEVEFEYYNFEALNIPAQHPSRDAFDTFYLDEPSPQPKKGGLLLRSHTSPVQIRVMEHRQPPVRVVVPGRVFRPDAADASHSFMFHQVEGLVVDRGITMAHLKGLLTVLLKRLFGPATATRFRPHYFPFTEPSAEVDIACLLCRGSGCSVCGQKGWVEVLGCGMVHPNVFRHVGYDPREVTGLAFGLGIERLAMLRSGINDIRLFFENDARLLAQF